MKSIKAAQSDLVNDTCAECGSFVDIGTVLEEDDTLLQLDFVGETAVADAAAIVEQTAARFSDAAITQQATDDGVRLAINFSCSAEKIIFQLQHRLP